MATILPGMVAEAEEITALPIERSEAIPIEPPAKPKSRLLHGISRISSSPSVAQIGRRRAVSNPYTGRGSSLSCVSLNTGSAPRNYDNSYSSQSSGAGFSTAPASVPGTPGITPAIDGLPNRLVERGALTPGVSTPTSALPLDMRPQSRNGLTAFPEHVEDYFSLSTPTTRVGARTNFDFWGEIPHEIKLSVLSYLRPKELVRASCVSKEFHKTCFDGQLWTSFDASEFYQEISAESLAKIIVAAGPFVKDLNLRGCVQVEHYKRAELVVMACKNLTNATLEGCRNFQRSTIHSLLKSNVRLANLNLTGVASVTNSTCKKIADSCPSLETLNISWCSKIDAFGLLHLIQGCPRLRDLRAREVHGFSDVRVAKALFETNNLERLIASGCMEITDKSFKTMLVGSEHPELDVLTGFPMVPSRKLRHLDISRCIHLTSASIKMLANVVPDLEGFQLSHCTGITDNGLEDLLASTPRLTHLDLENIPELTNSLLTEHLAKAPCAPILQHLSISNCENLGDVGMLPVIRACISLECIEMDNTKISDLVLAEAAIMVRTRGSRTTSAISRPRIGLQMIIYDCQNVTWTGIREILSRNSEIRHPTAITPHKAYPTFPTEIISLRCFYGWQQTVTEATKRVLRGDFAGAGRLERKWAEYMVANEEAGAGGAGGRRRRRRAREAQMMHADEEEGVMGGMNGGRRRRARSNGCQIM